MGRGAARKAKAAIIGTGSPELVLAVDRYNATLFKKQLDTTIWQPNQCKLAQRPFRFRFPCSSSFFAGGPLSSQVDSTSHQTSPSFNSCGVSAKVARRKLPQPSFLFFDHLLSTVSQLLM